MMQYHEDDKLVLFTPRVKRGNFIYKTDFTVKKKVSSKSSPAPKLNTLCDTVFSTKPKPNFNQEPFLAWNMAWKNLFHEKQNQLKKREIKKKLTFDALQLHKINQEKDFNQWFMNKLFFKLKQKDYDLKLLWQHYYQLQRKRILLRLRKKLSARRKLALKFQNINLQN